MSELGDFVDNDAVVAPLYDYSVLAEEFTVPANKDYVSP